MRLMAKKIVFYINSAVLLSGKEKAKWILKKSKWVTSRVSGMFLCCKRMRCGQWQSSHGSKV